MWLGIQNYNPQFHEDANQLVEKHKKELELLIGQSIIEIWILWNLTEDEWYTIAPVVIVTDAMQIEVCANKINEYSITFNTIDINQEVEPSDMGDEEVWFYKWKKYQSSNLFMNRQITGIYVIELLYETTVLQDYKNPDQVGRTFRNWLLHGIGFEIEDKFLSLYNAFDCNGIQDFKEFRRDIKYTSLC